MTVVVTVDKWVDCVMEKLTRSLLINVEKCVSVIVHISLPTLAALWGRSGTPMDTTMVRKHSTHRVSGKLADRKNDKQYDIKGRICTYVPN
jgi:hypothetical protein